MLRLLAVPGIYALVLLILLAPTLFTSRILLPADLLYSTAVWIGQTPQTPPQNSLLSDALSQFYPYHVLFRAELAEGRIALWNPYVLNGAPFLANSVSAVFSPLHWLLLFLPLNLFFEWSAFLKLLLAGSGIYFFCRRIGLPDVCAATGGATYMLAGYSIYFLVFPNTSTSCLFGWGLLALEDYVQTGKRRSLALFALVVAAGYLGGHVESGLHHHLAYGLYALFRNWRRVLAAAGSSLVGFSLAGVALVPFIEFMFESATFVERSAPERNPFYLEPGKWPALILPYFLGSPVGRGAGVPYEVMEGAVYFGIIPLFLVGFAFFSRTYRPWWIPLLAVNLWAVFILFGLPPVFDAFTALPVLKQGNHFHIAQLFQASGAILAAIGLHSLSAGSAGTRPLRLLALAAVGVLIAASFLQLRGLREAGWDQGVFFLWRDVPWPLYTLWTALSLAVLALAVKARRLGQGAAGLILAGGLLYGAGFNPAASPGDTVDLTPPVLEFLQRQPHDRVAVVGVGTLPTNYPMIWGLRDVRGYESLVLDRIAAFYAELLGELPGAHHFITELDERRLRMLRRAGCSYVLSDASLELEGLEVLSDHIPYLYRIPGNRRVVWARTVTAAAGPEEALRHALEERDVENVVLEGVGLAPSDAVEASETKTGGPGSNDIRWLVDRPDLVKLAVTVERDAWLVLRDTHASGWKAWIDGQETPIVRADYLFRAVRVPAGSRRIRFEYRPSSFRLGILLSLGALAVVSGLLFLPAGRKLSSGPGQTAPLVPGSF